MGYRPSLRVVVEPRDLSLYIYTVTRELLPLLTIDGVRVVLDLQERDRRRAVVQLRFIKIRVEPHVEAVAVLVERLPVVEAPGRSGREPHGEAHPPLAELEAVDVHDGRVKSEIVSSLLAGGAALEAVWVENGNPATPLGVANSVFSQVAGPVAPEAGAQVTEELLEES